MGTLGTSSQLGDLVSLRSRRTSRFSTLGARASVCLAVLAQHSVGHCTLTVGRLQSYSYDFVSLVALLRLVFCLDSV